MCIENVWQLGESGGVVENVAHSVVEVYAPKIKLKALKILRILFHETEMITDYFLGLNLKTRRLKNLVTSIADYLICKLFQSLEYYGSNIIRCNIRIASMPSVQHKQILVSHEPSSHACRIEFHRNRKKIVMLSCFIMNFDFICLT